LISELTPLQTNTQLTKAHLPPEILKRNWFSVWPQNKLVHQSVSHARRFSCVDVTRTVARKSFIGGLYVCARGALC